MNMYMEIVSQFRERSDLNSVIKNAFWLIIDKLVNLIAGFLVGAWVARYLGPAQFGILSYALAITAMFLPISQLGLADITIRELVRNQGRANIILGTVYTLQLVLSIFIFLLIGCYILYTNGIDRTSEYLVLILTARLIVSAGSNTFDWWFQSQVKAKFGVWARSLSLIITAVMLIGLIITRQALLMFAWIYLVQAIILMILITFFYIRNGGKLSSWGYMKDQAVSLLKDSWPLIISGVSVMIYMRIDQLMLKNMVSENELGLYSVAVRLSELWYFLPVALAASLFPSIIKARKSKSNENFEKMMQTFFDVMVGISYLVVLPTVLLGPWVIRLLFGDAYSFAGNILQIHIWAFIFVSLGVARSRWLMTENLTRFLMKTTIYGAVINILLNIILIPRYAGIGAAWSTLISYFGSAYLSTLLNKDLQNVFTQMSLSLFAPFRLGKIMTGLKDLLRANQ